MHPLRSVLMALTERTDVAGVVAVSDDGLVVEASLPAALDPDALAALATSVARSVRSLCDAAQAGPWTQAVVESTLGALVVQPLPSGGVLLVLAAEDGDLGTLLYDVRRHAPALESLL
jgi:predicted regulator of Ras-like GTPase activity (Roadblock/LC7/MglB family)